MKRFIGGVASLALAIALGSASHANAMGGAIDNLQKVVDFSSRIADTSLALNKFGQDITSVKLKLENLTKMVKNGAIGTTDLPNLLGQYFVDLGRVVNGSLREVSKTTLSSLAVLSDSVLPAQQQSDTTLGNLGRGLESIGNQIRSVKFHTDVKLTSLRTAASNINTAIFNQAVSNPNKISAATKVKAVMNLAPKTAQAVLGIMESTKTSVGQLQALSQMINEMAPAQKLRVVGGNMLELANPIAQIAEMLKDITDVAALFNDKVGHAGNVIVAVVNEVKGLLMQFGDVLASARDAGQAGPTQRPLSSQSEQVRPVQAPMTQQPTQQQASPYQTQQTSPYQTQQQWQQNQQGQPVPSPWQMVK